MFQMPAELTGVQALRGDPPTQYLRSDIYMKRSSRASDTSSAYSGTEKTSVLFGKICS